MPYRDLTLEIRNQMGVVCVVFFNPPSIRLFHLKTTPPMEEGNSVTIPVEQTVYSLPRV